LVVDRWACSGVGLHTCTPSSSYLSSMTHRRLQHLQLQVHTVAKSTPPLCTSRAGLACYYAAGQQQVRWRLLLVVAVGVVGSRDTYMCPHYPKLYISILRDASQAPIQAIGEYTADVPPHAHGFACWCCWAAWPQRCTTACMLYL